MARILAITSRLPYPPREGHQLRSWHLLRALAARHQVTLLSVVRDDDAPDEAGPLREVLAGLELFPADARRGPLATLRALLSAAWRRTPFVVEKYADAALRARIAALARDADMIHVDMLPLMALLPDHMTAPVVYNAHNVEHVLVETRARIDGRAAVRAFLRGQAPLLERFEATACARADLVLACSDIDAAALRTLAPGTHVDVVPNGVDLDGNRPRPAAPGANPASMVFVGQMGWFPNRDGVEWFLADVLPRIVAARPDAAFALVGKHDGLEVPADVATHVTLAGFVPDLRPYVHDAAVYVVPLRAGSGTRLKVLEAMALGKAIVTTTVGSEGIGLVHDASALFADDAQSFADAVLALLDDPARAARLGSAARECAQAHYGWDAIGSAMVLRYDALLAAPVAPGRATDAVSHARSMETSDAPH